MEQKKNRRPNALIDLHCDTLTDLNYTDIKDRDILDDPKRDFSLSSLPKDVNWGQFFAIFIPDEIQGEKAIEFYESNRDNFYSQMDKLSDRVIFSRSAGDMRRIWRAGKTAAFLTVENGSVLAGDLGRIKNLADDGVRAITLVWDGENEIGSGHSTEKGLSDFGKAVIPEMEKQGIIVDVSHLNDAGFHDLLKIAKKPFMATHSNSRVICAHKRNLTDEMIEEMVRRDCLIGLNYYTNFIRNDGDITSLDSFNRHVEQFIAMGAEKNIALGSDFDGAEMPDCLNTPEKAVGLYEYFLSHGLTEEQAEGIIYKNAQTFFRKNMS